MYRTGKGAAHGGEEENTICTGGAKDKKLQTLLAGKEPITQVSFPTKFPHSLAFVGSAHKWRENAVKSGHASQGREAQHSSCSPCPSHLQHHTGGLGATGPLKNKGGGGKEIFSSLWVHPQCQHTLPSVHGAQGVGLGGTTRCPRVSGSL